MPESQSDAIDSPIIFIDGVVEMNRRPRQRDIPGMPADAYDVQPIPKKKKKKPEDGSKDNS
jgi:hypothetical protein